MLVRIAWRLQPRSLGLIRQARLGGSEFTLERFDAPAPAPELAPQPVPGNPDASGAHNKTRDQGQQDEKINGCLEHDGERPQPERHGSTIGNGERDQYRRGNQGD
jgi:hypothetical protein